MLQAAALSLLISQCAPDVSPETIKTIIQVESGGNPYVVANVTDKTSHRFNSEKEAINFIDKLQHQGKKYSAGLMQIYVENFKHYPLTNKTVFNPCQNIKAGAAILKKCFLQAKKGNIDNQTAIRKAMSCYYSGNFTRGFKNEKDGKSYVQRIEEKILPSSYVVPAIKKKEENEEEKLTEKKSKSAVLTKNENVIQWDVFGDY
ncbi:lytic transglycosylase domain-containing protein [Arsenophonus nasoniae]|uniref:Lytic transglycosylase domain-containing protein n=1 Tax=Arsenophonus nasoniae TaxID=638 RepID=A0ABY8NXN4_9GAMM|nr:lytic transglycosylase domain-containing protein [Arsenophonus nasoniae]WGM09138.1 lytic transglycosylase domain-containing protein [Arsenophonus nasoniae]